MNSQSMEQSAIGTLRALSFAPNEEKLEEWYAEELFQDCNKKSLKV